MFDVSLSFPVRGNVPRRQGRPAPVSDAAPRRLRPINSEDTRPTQMLIAHISDTHLDLKAPASARRRKDFVRTMAHISCLPRQPDVIVHTGDVSHNATAEEYEQALQIVAGTQCPFVPILGNRDRRPAFLNAFSTAGIVRDQDGFVQYALDVGGARVVVADTLDVTRGYGNICDRRLSGLKALLGAAPGVPIVVAAHHPPTAMPNISEPVQYHDPSHAEALAACIAGNGNVVATLSGHIHRAESVSRGRSMTASHVMTVPSIATDLRQDSYPPALSECPVYQLHELVDGEVISRSCVVHR